jgi:anti-sigma regulatory factor (Ser/Thr protein kinase)/nucleoid DNA-binding protein
MNMTSADVSRRLSSSLSLDEAKGAAALQAFAKSLQTIAQTGKSVELPGLGRLEFGGNGAGSDDFAKDLTTGLANVLGDAATLLSTLCDLLHAELLQAQAVQIDGVGTFEVRKAPPKLISESNRYRLAAPPAVSFTFNAAPPLIRAAGEKIPTFKIAPEFKQTVDAMAASTILIVVPTTDFFYETLYYYFTKSGWTVKGATSVAEALRHVETQGAYTVLLDMAVPDASRLAQTIKSTVATSRIPLILMYPKGFTADSATSLLVTGDAQHVQPFEVRRLITGLESELLRAAEGTDPLRQKVTFMFPSEDSQIESAFDFGHKLFEQSGLNDEGQVALAAAFREAVGNANQHGNRYRKEKKIDVLYLLDREKITIVVKDMGDGFEHQRYVRHGKAGDAITAARERGMQGRMGGLGIMLMLKCCDRIEYNQKGNAVTLTKRLIPAAVPESPPPVPAA